MITHKESLMHGHALSIAQAAIAAVDPRRAVLSHLTYSPSTHLLSVEDGNDSTSTTLEYDLNDYNNILIAAFGKASVPMVEALCSEVLCRIPPHINMQTRGTVITKHHHATQQDRNTLNKYNIAVVEAGHPVPDIQGQRAAEALLGMCNTCNDRTLVLCCISGGGSALLCAPTPPLTLQHLQETNIALLQSGMTIQDMNRIRKRLERGKGGKLALACTAQNNATVLGLVLSDVIGDPLDVIASGPTVISNNDGDVASLVEEYNLRDVLPEDVLQVLLHGDVDVLQDTNNSTNTNTNTNNNKVHNVLVGNNEQAVEAAAEQATQLGYNTVILGSTIEGEAATVANMYVSLAQQLKMTSSKYNIAALPAALIGGGETTVTLSSTNSGKGGRNQELCLAAALALKQKGLRDVVLASVGTDGTDGPTDAAGAIVDGGTVDRIESTLNLNLKGDEALRRHDSYHFLQGSSDSASAGDDASALVKTGPTGTNVADVAVILVR